MSTCCNHRDDGLLETTYSKAVNHIVDIDFPFFFVWTEELLPGQGDQRQTVGLTRRRCQFFNIILGCCTLWPEYQRGPLVRKPPAPIRHSRTTVGRDILLLWEHTDSDFIISSADTVFCLMRYRISTRNSFILVSTLSYDSGTKYTVATGADRLWLHHFSGGHCLLSNAVLTIDTEQFHPCLHALVRQSNKIHSCYGRGHTLT